MASSWVRWISPHSNLSLQTLLVTSPSSWVYILAVHFLCSDGLWQVASNWYMGSGGRGVGTVYSGIQYTVFKISAGPRTLTGKIWVGPASIPSLSYINIYKFWQNCASVRQVSDLILKTAVQTKKMYTWFHIHYSLLAHMAIEIAPVCLFVYPSLMCLSLLYLLK